MNKEKILRMATELAPIVNPVVHTDMFRHGVINSLPASGCIGIELGVAGGHFSKRMVDSEKFKHFFGVDIYEDHHNTKEYKLALRLIGLNSNYKLLRMLFDEALDLFDDEYFDFIYIDGYAHTGEEGGRTLSDWYAKLKIGGIFAGDDYHDDWPLVKWAVNEMVTALRVELHVTGKAETTHMNRYPSWFIQKPCNQTFQLSNELIGLGQKIREATRAGRPT